MGALSDGGQGVEDAAVRLARIGLTLYVEDLSKAEGRGDAAIELVDLLPVAVEELFEARLGTGSTAAAEELDVL